MLQLRFNVGGLLVNSLECDSGREGGCEGIDCAGGGVEIGVFDTGHEFEVVAAEVLVDPRVDGVEFIAASGIDGSGDGCEVAGICPDSGGLV